MTLVLISRHVPRSRLTMRDHGVYFGQRAPLRSLPQTGSERNTGGWAPVRRMAEGNGTYAARLGRARAGNCETNPVPPNRYDHYETNPPPGDGLMRNEPNLSRRPDCETNPIGRTAALRNEPNTGGTGSCETNPIGLADRIARRTQLAARPHCETNPICRADRIAKRTECVRNH